MNKIKITIIISIVLLIIVSMIFTSFTYKKINNLNTKEENVNYLSNVIADSQNISTQTSDTIKPKTSLANLTLEDILNVDPNKKEEVQRIVQFDNSNVRVLSNINYDEMYAILKDTNLSKVSKAFVDAEQKYKINAIFLASIAALESGWYTSSRSIDTNNLTGMNVTSDSAIGNTYGSPYDCILDTAKLLDESYLGEGKPFFKGYSTKDVNYYYCVKDSWSVEIDKIGKELMDKYNANFNNQSKGENGQ